MNLPRDSIAQVYHAQVAFIGALVAANRKRLEAAQADWDWWYDTIAKLPEEARASFPRQAAVVEEVEAAADEIVKERGKLPGLRDAVMSEKIIQLAIASAGSELPLGARIAQDFDAFRDWRRNHFDGVDCDMFGLVECRKPSVRPARRPAPLFDTLFVLWARTAGVPVAEAELAARLELESRTDATLGSPGFR